MEPNYEYVGGYERYIARARALNEAGDRGRADAFAAVASALQLFPPGRQFDPPRGQFFGPMMSGGFGEVPDMAFVRRPETIACLRGRMRRFRDLFRRARIADTVWEFSEKPDPDAARVAVDAYLDAGGQQIAASAEFAAMMGAGALARALALARAINDNTRIERAVRSISAAIDELAARDEHVALFTLIEALLPLDRAVDLGPAEAALDAHLRRLESRDADNFHFRQGVIELQIRLARRGGRTERVQALQRMYGEAIAAEAAWKGAHYDNGALVAMHFYAKAADHFEKIGDRERAGELRKLERAAYGGARFTKIQASVEVDLKPYRDWLAEVFVDERGRELVWPAIVTALPLPTPEQIAKQQEANARETPLLSMIGVSTVRPEGVLEDVSPEEAARRRSQTFAYQGHALHVATLVRLAREVHGAGPFGAAAALHATGLFDETGRALLERVLRALEARDWTSAAYLAGPLIERLVRAIAEKAGIEVMYTERAAGRARRMRVAIEVLLRRLPLPEPVLAYVRWTMTHPGLNLRNEAGHGLLEVAESHEGLGAHVLYTLLALSFADLDLVATTSSPTDT